MSRNYLSLIRVGLLAMSILLVVLALFRCRNLVDTAESESERETDDNNRVKKAYFISLVPTYFFAGSYIVQSALKESTYDRWVEIPLEVSIGTSVFLVVLAFYALYAALGKLPQNILNQTYQASVFLGVVTIGVYMIDWIRHAARLVELNIDVWLFHIFFYGGLVLILGFMVYHLYNVYKLRFH